MAAAAEATAAAQPAPASTYHLPIEQLSALAQAAGLQWVQSDAEKIAAVQAAIAAEPAPIRIPRERPRAGGAGRCATDPGRNPQGFGRPAPAV